MFYFAFLAFVFATGFLAAGFGASCLGVDLVAFSTTSLTSATAFFTASIGYSIASGMLLLFASFTLPVFIATNTATATMIRITNTVIINFICLI
jgi:hypothetical protein